MTRVRTGFLFWTLCLVGVIVAIAATFTPTQQSDPPAASDARISIAPIAPIAPIQPPSDLPVIASLIAEPEPTRLRIPKLGISAEVASIGMQDEVTMEVPEDISVVGWFRYSPTPLSGIGTTVLVGHRDGATDPNGVFRNLDKIEPGDRVTVIDEDGTRWRYEVSDTELLDSAQFATAAEGIFDIEKEARLILITCGGEYIQSDGGYQSNTVVTAFPISR